MSLNDLSRASFLDANGELLLRTDSENILEPQNARACTHANVPTRTYAHARATRTDSYGLAPTRLQLYTPARLRTRLSHAHTDSSMDLSDLLGSANGPTGMLSKPFWNTWVPSHPAPLFKEDVCAFVWLRVVSPCLRCT